MLDFLIYSLKNSTYLKQCRFLNMIYLNDDHKLYILYLK